MKKLLLYGLLSGLLVSCGVKTQSTASQASLQALAPASEAVPQASGSVPLEPETTVSSPSIEVAETARSDEPQTSLAQNAQTDLQLSDIFTDEELKSLQAFPIPIVVPTYIPSGFQLDSIKTSQTRRWSQYLLVYRGWIAETGEQALK